MFHVLEKWNRFFFLRFSQPSPTFNPKSAAFFLVVCFYKPQASLPRSRLAVRALAVALKTVCGGHEAEKKVKQSSRKKWKFQQKKTLSTQPAIDLTFLVSFFCVVKISANTGIQFPIPCCACVSFLSIIEYKIVNFHVSPSPSFFCCMHTKRIFLAHLRFSFFFSLSHICFSLPHFWFLPIPSSSCWELKSHFQSS